MFTSDFVINLFITNMILIAGFMWINYNYHQIRNHIEIISATTKTIDPRQKKVLQHFFPFYKKLSPNLKRVYEQKLLFFYHTKSFNAAEGFVVRERMRIYISAYAAQVSLGFKGYGFSHINGVVLHPQKFYSSTKKDWLCWELDSQGNLHVSWKEFFEQMRKKVVLPIGLDIMTHAIKKDGDASIKDEIFKRRNEYYLVYSYLEEVRKQELLFKGEDFLSKDDLLEACLKNYFSSPVEFKNCFPELFYQIDRLLYSQLKAA